MLVRSLAQISKTHSSKNGFTLIEMLITIAVLSILFGLVLVLVNPVRRFAEARNVVRAADINDIFKAISLYMVENRGENIPGLDGSYRMIGTATSGCEITCSDPVVSRTLNLSLASQLNQVIPVYSNRYNLGEYDITWETFD